MTAVHDRRWWISLGLVGLAAAAVACGSRNPVAPGAPSAVAASPTPGPTAAGGATINGTVIGVAGGARIATHAVAMTVTVTGTSSTSTVDGNGRFVLQNVPPGHVDLRFSGPSVDAHLGLDDVAEHASITITVRVNGSSAQLDNDNREEPNNEAQVEGLVTSRSASTLTVNGRLIQVTAATQIVHGDTPVAFSAIAVGDRVHVKGTLSGTTGVVARKIEVQQQAAAPADDDDDDGEDHDDDHNGARAEASGAVAGLGGTCPALTFTVGGTTVHTSASTQFKDTACSGLKAGNTVEVKGTRQADNSIAASRVEKK